MLGGQDAWKLLSAISRQLPTDPRIRHPSDPMVFIVFLVFVVFFELRSAIGI